jgi:hypothetical protein
VRFFCERCADEGKEVLALENKHLCSKHCAEAQSVLVSRLVDDMPDVED